VAIRPTPRLWRVTGTVDVDTTGRLRRLEFTSRSSDTAHGVAGAVHGVLEFRDFGTRERVTIPPPARCSGQGSRSRGSPGGAEPRPTASRQSMSAW